MSERFASYIPKVVGINAGNFAGDAFSRLRTSGTANRWDCEFIYNDQPYLMDKVVSGNGSIVFDSAARDVVLSTGGSAVADGARFCGHYHVPYTPGNSQLIDITGSLGSEGVGFASVFLRSSVSGSTTEQEIAETDWNNCVEPFDWTKSHILAMDFQSLKVGRIRFVFNRKGVPVEVAEIFNDNIRATGFWQSPSLPPYWRIYNTADMTICEMGYGDEFNGIGVRVRYPLNPVLTMRAICSTVKSEGGKDLFDLDGFPRSADSEITRRLVGTTPLPVISIRVAPTLGGLVNRGLYIPRGFSVDVNHPIYYQMIYRPVLTGAVWLPIGNSGMQYDVSATGSVGGVRVASEYFSGGSGGPQSRPDSKSGVLGKTVMALGANNEPDILSLVAVRSTGTNSEVAASISWDEIR